VGEILSNIGKGLAVLGQFLLDLFGAAWNFLVKDIPAFAGQLVKGIIDGLVSLPGKIVDIIASAFRNLKIDIGPFHIRSTGITIDLPKIETVGGGGHGAFRPSYQHGGWAGLRGPEMAMLGERGPEFVIPNHMLGKLGGRPQTIILQIDGRTVAAAVVPAVSRQMYYELRRAAPTLART
jgi:hypothetical protein